MAYSVTPSAEDCYPGTSVLINKLGITDQKRLNENETLITSVKMLQIEMQPITCLLYTSLASNGLLSASSPENDKERRGGRPVDRIGIRPDIQRIFLRTPVSYTHLDVYKRQYQYRAV